MVMHYVFLKILAVYKKHSDQQFVKRYARTLSNTLYEFFYIKLSLSVMEIYQMVIKCRLFLQGVRTDLYRPISGGFPGFDDLRIKIRVLKFSTFYNISPVNQTFETSRDSYFCA